MNDPNYYAEEHNSVENGESPETEKNIPLASGRVMVNERATAYVIQNPKQVAISSLTRMVKFIDWFKITELLGMPENLVGENIKI